MKIKGTCLRCGREFLAEEVVQAHGHCPRCGRAFNGDYTALLAQALQRAEIVGTALQEALEEIGGMELAMEMDEAEILQPITDALRSARRKRARA